MLVMMSLRILKIAQRQHPHLMQNHDFPPTCSSSSTTVAEHPPMIICILQEKLVVTFPTHHVDLISPSKVL